MTKLLVLTATLLVGISAQAEQTFKCVTEYNSRATVAFEGPNNALIRIELEGDDQGRAGGRSDEPGALDTDEISIATYSQFAIYNIASGEFTTYLPNASAVLIYNKGEANFSLTVSQSDMLGEAYQCQPAQ